MDWLWLQQLRALLWKSWIVRKRHYITTFFEFLIPLLMVIFVTFAAYKIREFSSGGQDVDPTNGTGIMPAKDYPNPVFNSEKDFKFPLTSTSIFYTPKNNATKRFIDEMNLVLVVDKEKDRKINFTAFNTEIEMESYINELMEKSIFDAERNAFKGAIVFKSVPEKFSKKDEPFQYTIRDIKFLPTSGVWAMKFMPGPSFHPTYNDYTKPGGLGFLQMLVNEAYLNLKANDLHLNREHPISKNSSVKINISPYPPYRLGSTTTIVDLVPSVLVTGFIVAFPVLVKRIVDEKFSGSRELMKMMGLANWIYWLSHFINNSLFFVPVSLVSLGILFISVFKESSYGPLALLFTIYSINVILFGFLFSILFKKPVISVVIAVIFWQLMGIPVQLLDPQLGRDLSGVAKTWFSLLPNSALAWGLKYVSQKEGLNEGIHWKNMDDKTTTFGPFTFATVLGMMTTSCAILSFLVWYLDNVWPWQPGVPKPFWFPFTKSYWLGGAEEKNDSNDFAEFSKENEQYFEPVDNNLPISVKLSGVTKVYKSLFGGSKLAVDNVSIRVCQDQITCLLGHNGAGKTTTMSMITGMFPPTTGSITINGYDLMTDTRNARRSMSLCPQNNPLYNELTVAEHLFLYGAIKGCGWNFLHQEVAKVAGEVKLEDKTDTVSTSLSGGMKRKLCLGIALVGGTKVIILDEPTSGLDTEVRRSVWDLLRTARKTRTILLSTHDMEEADALSDRIIIMTEGQVSCAGSPMFLKKVFGAGYTLKMAKRENFDEKATLTLIQMYFQHSRIKQNIGSEISFSMESEPNVTDSSQLPPFFKELEQQKDNLGVASFGLSVTSMEEVFLKVGEVMTKQSIGKETRRSTSNGTASVPTVRLTGIRRHLQIFRGLFLKRFHHAKRNFLSLIYQMLIPSIMFIGTFAMCNTILGFVAKDMLYPLSIKDMYGPTTVFLARNSGGVPRLENMTRKLGQHIEEIDTKTTNLTQWLLDKADVVGTNRYLSTYVIGAEVSEPSINLWASNEAIFSVPLAIDLLYKSLDADMSGSNDSSLFTDLHFSQNSAAVSKKITNAIVYYLWAFMIPLTVPFLAASYIIFPITERSCQAKLVQLMTGIHPMMLHLVSFVFDFIVQIISSLMILAVFFIFDRQGFFTESGMNFFSMLLLLVAFGSAAMPIAYTVSNFIGKPSTGFTILNMFYTITGLAFTIISQVLESIPNEIVSQGTKLGWSRFFCLSPIFSMTNGFMKIYKIGMQRDYCNSLPNIEFHRRKTCFMKPEVIPQELVYCCPNLCEDVDLIKNIRKIDSCPLDNPIAWRDAGIGKELFIMFVSFAVFVVLLFLVEHNWISVFRKLFARPPIQSGEQLEDDDVRKEKETVNVIAETNSYSREALVADQLTKYYRKAPKPAVNGLSFTVHPKEVFGLLGVNGAGKTTTFGMITGDLFPSYGDCYQGNLSISKDRLAYQKNLGYCPQFNPLLESLTGRETLFLFGRLRGLPEGSIAHLVNQLMRNCDLQQYADKKTQSYSGGNKRKLSLAIALIGNPSILLLDEPTAGVDPGARRKIWTILNNEVSSGNSSIILTSHSMDECEALCSRLGIMVAGQMRCLGSAQHIKVKYGQGYTIMVKFKMNHLGDAEYSNRVAAVLGEQLPGLRYTDCHETLWTIRVPDASIPWSVIFERMQKISQDMDLEDYSVSDTTLEQVFVAFARS